MRVFTDWLLTPERAAVHVPTATAVVADLHLGYDQARRHGGEAVPTFGLEEIVADLSKLVERSGFRRLVVAGDLCEGRGADEAIEGLLGWVEGNGVELA